MQSVDRFTYPRLLTIAGSDSCGGAGIQADLKTFSALGCYGMTAITALTAQNTVGVQSIVPTPAAMLRTQIDSIMSDVGCDAAKIGMVPDAPGLFSITTGWPRMADTRSAKARAGPSVEPPGA